MDWRLRRAEPADAAALALVAAATFLEAYHDIVAGDDMILHLAAKSSPEAFAAWITDPTSAVVIAETQRVAAPIGYAVLTGCDLPLATTAQDIELRRIYVLAPFHAAGVGRGLLSEAVAAARAMGASRMLLGVNAGNERALRFYRRGGFAQVGTRRFQVGAVLHDDLLLAREL